MNACTMASNSLSIYSQSLPAFAEQATCANPYWSMSSDLLPQMSSSARPPNEGNSQRIVEDEIQALLGRIDNSIYEWRSDDGTNTTEEVINVPNAPVIPAGENTEFDTLLSGTQPTTTWSKQMGCLAFYLLRGHDSLTAISNCLPDIMWIIDMNNNVEENNSSGDTSGESFQSNGTSGGGSYQQTGRNGCNPPTRSRAIILIKAMLMLMLINQR
ncbi:uncharacterized protein FTJAE_2691 [Fusarium tjaetaba]|uniref:Uncharacterized protein n=1 Tax=Fusarium tjaetaba TaxID=1567544 RepID=A0A8H5S3S5_9HYPO|nr:uncharacterized protein FTJAE_2691 [Fusarium tjaetaba]KAF5644728.1 hypothetical protein FTJAE_2691 [Fusarium tjaetaba]